MLNVIFFEESENLSILLNNISQLELLVRRRDLVIIISCAALSRFRTGHQISLFLV